MAEAAATETHAAPEGGKLPTDAAAEISRRVSALESAHEEGTSAISSASLWVGIVSSAIVAVLGVLLAWGWRRLKARREQNP